MPSQKHKKKKKKRSEKQHENDSNVSKRRHSNAESDVAREEKSSKRKKKHRLGNRSASLSSGTREMIHFMDSDSDDEKTEDLLTSVVRRLYTNHLHEALANNFKNWTENCNEFSEDSINELSTKFSTVLEQRALRGCMISELYRENMVLLIKQIKECTGEGRLYIEGNKLAKVKGKLPVNKETQTEKSNSQHKTLCVVETATQTESHAPLQLDLALPKQKQNPSSQGLLPDLFDSSYNEVGISRSLNFRNPEPTSTNQDVCSITSTSDIIVPVLEAAQPLHDNEKAMVVSDPWLPDTDNTDQIENLPIHNCRNSVDDQTYNSTKSDNEQENTNDENQLPSKQDQNRVKVKDSLDSRLSEMGLISFFNNTVEKSPSETSVERSRKSNWYYEEIAQSCNLTRVLMKLSTKHREKVLSKIKEFFGDDDLPLTELTEKNITICRKRIASVVVAELTPIYEGKRIASRPLFKFLAEKFTKSIMEHSYAPDARFIRSKVIEFFRGGRVVMSETDCV